MLSFFALAQSVDDPAAASAAAAVAADPAVTLPVESVPATDLAQPADPLPVSDTASAGESAAVVPPVEPVPAAVDPVSPVTTAADPVVPPVELLPAVVDSEPDAASTAPAESMAAPSPTVGETAAGLGIESAAQIVARVLHWYPLLTWTMLVTVTVITVTLMTGHFLPKNTGPGRHEVQIMMMKMRYQIFQHTVFYNKQIPASNNKMW